MYDRRLDSVIAAADCGSFSKAARQLGISTPALAKRIETFEDECEIVLFNRTRRGVVLTPAGASIVEDARRLMRQSRDIVRRAREQDVFGGTTVRLGISAACPARAVLDAWPRIHEADPALHLELVPIGDIYDDDAAVVSHLGGSVDVVEVTDAPFAACEKLWGGACRVTPLPSVGGESGPGVLRPDDGCASFALGALLWPLNPSSATVRFVASLRETSCGEGL